MPPAGHAVPPAGGHLTPSHGHQTGQICIRYLSIIGVIFCDDGKHRRGIKTEEGKGRPLGGRGKNLLNSLPHKLFCLGRF